MESIPLNKIICESNRKYTKDEDFEQLMNSIALYGIIQAPVVRRVDEDQFKVIAGRRRIEAARRLEFPAVNCEIREVEDPVDDEELALTENVNRQEMHPLDEASAFKRMADKNAPIEEIAQYYARSPSAIYKRLRLCGLAEELKVMFRDGKMNIASAVVLAELPEEDQKDFFTQYGHKDTIEHTWIYQFVNKKQRYIIKDCMREDCEGCNERTHNEGNELFTEFRHLSDVCLNADCYRVKWYSMMAARLNEQLVQMLEAGMQTDNKVYISGGVLELIYKKASFVNITDNEKKNQKYEILREKDFEFTGESNRKKDACWMIRTDCEGKISVKRVGYKAKPPREKTEKTEHGSIAKNVDYKNYGKEAIESVAEARGVSSKELAKTLIDKKIMQWEFKNEIEALVTNRIIDRRIQLESSGDEPPCEYFLMFLHMLEEEGYRNYFNEKQFNDKEKQRFKDLFNKESFSKLSLNLPDEMQKIFHFLLLCLDISSTAPNLDELKDIEKNDNIFWKYARMSKDEYRTMYLEAAKDVTAAALDSKHGKKGKKKAAAPSSDVRRCRVCGCTDDNPCVDFGGDSCSWAEDDLCSACADGNKDNYPFEPDADENNETIEEEEDIF